MRWQVLVTALFFAGMGLAGLVSPPFVVRRFGLDPATPDARNEVRAVYGGFGVAVAALLSFGELGSAAFADGACITVAVAVFGMALGRVGGALVERPGRWPLIFFAVEVLLGALLLWAVRPGL